MSEFWWYEVPPPYAEKNSGAMDGGGDDGLVGICLHGKQWHWHAIPNDESVDFEFRGTAPDKAAAMKAAEDFILAWPTLTESQKAKIIAARREEIAALDEEQNAD